MKLTRMFAVLLCLALAFSLTACVSNSANPSDDTRAGGKTAAEPAADPAATDPADPVLSGDHSVTLDPLAAPKTAESYDAVRLSLMENYRSPWGYYGGKGVISNSGEDMEIDPAAPEPTDGVNGNEGIEDTGTNVQVPGVDEADIVKTDGSYLYCLTQDALVIYRAAGADTEKVAEIPVNTAQDELHGMPTALLIGEDRAAAFIGCSSYGLDDDGAYYDTVLTRVMVFDITDRTAPTLLQSVSVDGYYQSARLLEGNIYLITTKFLWYIDEDVPSEQFIPALYCNGVKTMLAPEEIWICPNPASTAFTAVTSLSLRSGEVVDKLAFTDNTDTVYMDREGIYLARPVTASGESAPYTEDQYTVVERQWVTRTEIKRIRVADGKLTLDGTAEVEGAPLNQFCMDVREGKLRIATTASSETYKVYTDEKHGWENYEHLSGGSESRITVLDEDLHQIGLLTGLGEDERIYAVRYVGALAYVVTFRETDPVFTVDLSDPTAPKLMGELKLPGVSKYLHPFSEDLLFGLGQAVETQGMQLTMFDVSDPKNVTVHAQTILEEFWGAEAEYDHKALMIRPELGLIGFAAYTENGDTYALIRYENDAFTVLANLELGYLPNDARGIVLDDCLYICGGTQICVISLTDLTLLTEITDAVG